MRDYLLDIVKNTHGLGIVDLVKIVGTAEETTIESVTEDRTVILKGKINTPVPEFVGTFGMPNLGKLSTILNIPEYKEDAKITIGHRADNGAPEYIHFENAAGDFKNDYRFMSEQLVVEKVKSAKLAVTPTWNVDIEPSVASIQRLKFQASVHTEEPNFVLKTENGALKVYFGDHSSHAGSFVFQPDVTGTLTKSWAYPVSAFISILNLSGDKKLRISDMGLVEISVNTGITTYNYMLPAQTK